MDANGRPQISEENRTRKIKMFAQDLKLSLGQTATEMKIHRTKVRRSLRRVLNYFSYKPQTFQQISDEDKAKKA